MGARERVDAALQAIAPWDAVEADHRADALAWVRSGAPIWRTAKPATPPRHLVAYFLLVDAAARSSLLVDHRLAGLWLPTGGHVDPGEDPATTVARECREELGFSAPLRDGLASQPLFVTQTVTVGLDAGHCDVSLWYVCDADARRPVEFDPRELRAARWWPFDELATADATRFDPHFPRFLGKFLAQIDRSLEVAGSTRTRGSSEPSGRARSRRSRRSSGGISLRRVTGVRPRGYTMGAGGREIECQTDAGDQPVRASSRAGNRSRLRNAATTVRRHPRVRR